MRAVSGRHRRFNQAASERGHAVARWLGRSWRPNIEPPDFDEPLASEVLPFLLGTGAGALAFAQIERRAESDRFEGFDVCRQAYRWHAAQASLHEFRLIALAETLNRQGIPFLLTKGWAVALEYGRPELRPYGDFDLAFPPQQLEAARNCLIATAERFGPLDLHAGVPDLADRSWDNLWCRRRCLTVDSASVAVLSREDQFRHVCLHLLRHGLWRPLWLCDVGVMLDRNGPEFDWDLCLAGPAHLKDWILTTVGLAERVLGAQGPDGPLGDRCRQHAERWESIVMRQWGALKRGDSHSRDSDPIASYLSRPWQIWRALGHRWPNPVEATFKSTLSPRTWLPLSLVQSFAFARRAFFKVAPRGTAPPTPPSFLGIETHDPVASKR